MYQYLNKNGTNVELIASYRSYYPYQLSNYSAIFAGSVMTYSSRLLIYSLLIYVKL